jgi:hypothetical protein
MKNENLFERGNHNQEPPTNTSKGAVNRNQDAIDILDKARSSFVYPYILETDANYHAYMLLLHAAEYLELQGRI